MKSKAEAEARLRIASGWAVVRIKDDLPTLPPVQRAIGEAIVACHAEGEYEMGLSLIRMGVIAELMGTPFLLDVLDDLSKEVEKFQGQRQDPRRN